jgi:hypothetical protein
VSRRKLVTVLLLAAVLAIQLVHYNRDSLAADPKYGSFVRQLYANLGMALYPTWRLDAFEVRSTEAVAGRSADSALDILANIEVVGPEPVGAPLVRVVLRDRWANPVASRVFDASQYLTDRKARRRLFNPGTVLPVDISVEDPGAEAQGYVVDVCLPNRQSGLQCQLAKDPFQ